jgi:hypothetical protein
MRLHGHRHRHMHVSTKYQHSPFAIPRARGTVKVAKISSPRRREAARAISSIQLSLRSLSRPDRYRRARPRKREEKKRQRREPGPSERDPKLRGIAPAAPRSSWRFPFETIAACFRTCLRAMCAMEARLNIDFGHAIGETKGEKRREPKGRGTIGGICQFREMIPATGSLSCSLLLASNSGGILWKPIKFRL